jgi:magnesium chelatase family protein
VNLAPADIRKEGPGFDLPIALGILMATGQVEHEDVDRFMVTGELSLDGSVRSVSGVLPMALGAKAAGKRAIVVPRENTPEAAELFIYPGNRHPLQGGIDWSPEQLEFDVDLSEVKGQQHVKRALEVAAAGGHNMLMM